MRLLDWLDKMLPGRQTTASYTDNIRQQYVDEYMKAASKFPGATDPHVEWATRSEQQWRERATKGKCLWCTVPYEDDSGSCTKCGAPKEVEAVDWNELQRGMRQAKIMSDYGRPRFSNVTWRI